MQKLIRPLFSLFQNSLKEINENKKTVTHYISCGEPNDYSQVLNPAGYDDSRYRKNPIVLFQHGLNDMFSSTPAKLQLDFVLGKNTSITTEGNFLKAETEFRNDDNSGFASDVFNLYRLGFLNGWSKWFYPINEPRYDSANGNTYYDKWGIYEYSAVFVPVDGEAVTGEVNYLNALESVKSDSMKKYFLHAILGSGIAAESGAQKYLEEINSLRREINIIKDTNSSSNTNEINELKNYTQSSIEKYHKLIMPRLEHFAGSIKQLNDLRCNLGAIIESAVKQSLRNITGKID